MRVGSGSSPSWPSGCADGGDSQLRGRRTHGTREHTCRVVPTGAPDAGHTCTLAAPCPTGAPDTGHTKTLGASCPLDSRMRPGEVPPGCRTRWQDRPEQGVVRTDGRVRLLRLRRRGVQPLDHQRPEERTGLPQAGAQGQGRRVRLLRLSRWCPCGRGTCAASSPSWGPRTSATTSCSRCSTTSRATRCSRPPRRPRPPSSPCWISSCCGPKAMQAVRAGEFDAVDAAAA